MADDRLSKKELKKRTGNLLLEKDGIEEAREAYMLKLKGAAGSQGLMDELKRYSDNIHSLAFYDTGYNFMYENANNIAKIGAGLAVLTAVSIMVLNPLAILPAISNGLGVAALGVAAPYLYQGFASIRSLFISNTNKEIAHHVKQTVSNGLRQEIGKVLVSAKHHKVKLKDGEAELAAALDAIDSSRFANALDNIAGEKRNLLRLAVDAVLSGYKSITSGQANIFTSKRKEAELDAAIAAITIAVAKVTDTKLESQNIVLGFIARFIPGFKIDTVAQIQARANVLIANKKTQDSLFSYTFYPENKKEAADLPIATPVHPEASASPKAKIEEDLYNRLPPAPSAPPASSDVTKKTVDNGTRRNRDSGPITG